MRRATTKTTTIRERTIMTKRPCKHCGTEIYLQHIPITTKLKWISLDAEDGRLHDCPARPLALDVKTLIQTAIDSRMKPTTNNNIHTNFDNMEIINRIDRIINDLEFIRQQHLTSHKLLLLYLQ